MYRSKLMLDLLDPSVQRALRDANDMHRNLMRAFGDLPAGSARASESLLYSVMNYNGRPAVYVISSSKPDWAKVRGYTPLDEPREISDLKNRFRSGEAYGFRLFASPTKKVAREGKLSARAYLRTEVERREWLERHAAAGGFKLISVREEAETKVKATKNGSQIIHTGVLFTGVLRVEDVEAFWKAYGSGIGPGKAYGLGMLMVGKV